MHAWFESWCRQLMIFNEIRAKHLDVHPLFLAGEPQGAVHQLLHALSLD